MSDTWNGIINVERCVFMYPPKWRRRLHRLIAVRVVVGAGEILSGRTYRWPSILVVHQTGRIEKSRFLRYVGNGIPEESIQ